jgi:hypothetical protein
MRPAVALLLLALAGCHTVERLPAKPNPALTRDCDYPVIEGETWRDLAQAYERRGEALRECSARMRAIRNDAL